MKNLKIRGKLILSFGIILVLMLSTTVLSYLALNNMYSKVEQYKDDALPSTVRIWNIRRYNISLQRYHAMLQVANTPELKQKYYDKILSEQEGLDALIEEFKQNTSTTEETLNQIISILEVNAACQVQLLELANAGTPEAADEARAILTEQYIPNASSLGDAINVVAEEIDTEMKVLSEKANQDKQLDIYVLIASAAASVVLCVVLVLLITRSIAKPAKEIENMFQEMANGNMHAHIEYESNDELGRMADSIRIANSRLSSYIQDITEKLTFLSNGNMVFTVDLDYVGDFAAIKHSLISTAEALNRTMNVINSSAELVNSGSDQVSSAAQSLASGAAEQAASVEELSASVTNVSQKAEENVINVRKATEYVSQVSVEVAEGNNQMRTLNSAMKEISEASQKISNITKVIEDIAFQTNILALNAAIEAARAGVAGAGFAVVADEVRNLAAKSAEAAKQTADLIQYSVITVADGEKLASKTAEILHGVAERAELANQSIQKIELSSSEQADAIDQITQGLAQVSAVVQINAAAAEESSASSEELAAQAQTLKEEISKFQLS